MKIHCTMLAAAALSAISTLAIAQTTVAPATPPESTGAPPNAATSASQGGLRMADKAAVELRFVTVKPADFIASKIVGTKVYNNENDSLGEIADLVIENGKTITGIIVSVGGFLGLGETYVVLDPSTVVLNQKDDTWKAFVNTSKDNLKDAQKFSYKKS